MKIVILCLIFFTISCGEKGRKKINEPTYIQQKNVSLSKNNNELIEILNDSIKRNMLDLECIEITSKAKNTLKSSSMKDTTICENWNISDEHIKHILKYSVPIEPEEWHYVFDVLPCILEGKLKYKGISYNYSLNGGSWIDIGNEISSVRMGYYVKDTLHLFLSNPYCYENE